LRRHPLSNNNYGIYTNSKLYEKTNNLSDIVCSNTKENFKAKKEKASIAISNKLANNIREIKKGVAIINNKGIYFFVIKSRAYIITHHYFFPFDQFAEIGATIKKKIYYRKSFTIRNIYSDSPNEDYYKAISLYYECTPIEKISQMLRKHKGVIAVLMFVLAMIVLTYILQFWIY